MKTQQGTLVNVLATVVAVIAFDQITKEIVLREIGPGTGQPIVEIIPGIFQFNFVRNTGSAFGLFQGQSAILTVLALGAIIFLATYYFRKARNDTLVAVALGLQLGGAVGNVVDRIRHGYVVDFIDVSSWPVFNMADSAITIGVILLMYALIFRDYDATEPGSERQLRSAGDDS